MTVENTAFLAILLLAAGFFALNVQRLVAYMNIGLPESRTDDPFARLWNALTVGIAQTKNPSRPGHRGDARDDLLGVHGAHGGRQLRVRDLPVAAAPRA